MERERGSRQDLPRRNVSAERLRQAASWGDEGVVLGGANLPSLAAPQEETPTAQPVRRSGAWTDHQHLSPAPPEAQGAGWLAAPATLRWVSAP